MMSLTFGLFTQVSGSGPLGPLVILQFCVLFKPIEHQIKTEVNMQKKKTHSSDLLCLSSNL